MKMAKRSKPRRIMLSPRRITRSYLKFAMLDFIAIERRK